MIVCTHATEISVEDEFGRYCLGLFRTFTDGINLILVQTPAQPPPDLPSSPSQLVNINKTATTSELI